MCATAIEKQDSKLEYPSPPWTFLGKLWCCWVDVLPICQITVIVFPIPAVIFSELMHLLLWISFSIHHHSSLFATSRTQLITD